MRSLSVKSGVCAMLMACALAYAKPLQSQTAGQIAGTVTTETGQPLSGASVVVVGTRLGTLTGANGRYTISGVPAGQQTVRATMIGYADATQQVTVAAGQAAAANLQLTAQAIELDEIVAIGYGTARRRDLTGAVASVRGEDLVARAAPTTSVSNALIGKSPGVQVVTNAGTPGASARVQVRGSNSITASSDPLYVVDGIPLSPGSTPLNSIDPSNIESIQILKDASGTAIYGARGANGVVLITTKRGERGGNQVSLETSYGVQQPTKFIEALTGPEFMQLLNEGMVNSGRPARYSAEQIANAQTHDYPRLMLNNLEWQPQQSHALTISGGDEATRYLVSGNFMSQDGIVVNSGFERFGGRVNLDRDVSDQFRIGVSLSGTRSVQNVNGTEATGTCNSCTGLTTALQYDPTVAPRDPNTGAWNQRVVLNENFVNPYTESMNRRDPINTTGLLTSIFGEYDVTDNLKLRSTVGGNFVFSRSMSYSPRTIASGNEVGVASQSSGERRELTNENTATYRRELGPGNLEVLVGASVQTSNFETFRAESRNFPVDALLYNNLGAGSQLIGPSSGVTEWTLLSQLGRVHYNLLDKYLFTVTARRDGSSRFGANNKWAVFPSAAFAWRVIDEGFMQDQGIFSDLKLRVSYGRTGNQAITEYQSLARLNTAFIGLGTGTDVVTLAPETAAPNPDLKWETQDQFNAGLDMGFLDNRVNVTLDAYQSQTSNLLLSRLVAWETGNNTQLQNVGAVQNRGVELALTTVNVERENLGWRTTLSLAANRNEVTQLYGNLQSLGAGSSTQVGEPLNTFVGYQVLGLWQQGDQCNLINTRECTPGEYKILDANGDQVINDNDRVNLGNPQADVYGGLNSDLRFGPLSLEAFFNFSYGNEVQNASMRYTGLVGGASNEIRERALRRWTPTNTNTDVPRANNQRVNQRTYSTYIEDASFLRLQTLSVGYQVPAGLIPGASSARLLVTGQNLWVTTKYSGWDPEQAAVDQGGYPRARSWNVGMNLTF